MAPCAQALGEIHGAEGLLLPTLVADLAEDVLGETTDAGAKEKVIKWLARRTEVGDANGDTIYRRFAHQIELMRHELLPRFFKSFVPANVAEPAGLPYVAARKRAARRTRERVDPIVLVRTACMNGSPAGMTRLRFEALRDLALGYLALWLVTDAERIADADRVSRPPSGRAHWDQDKSTKDRELFLQYLMDAGVITRKPEEVAIVAQQHPTHPFRVAALLIGPDRGCFAGELQKDAVARKFGSGHLVHLAAPEGEVPALFFSRRKGIMETIAKMILERHGSPKDVGDRRGMRFAYRTLEELVRGSAFVSARTRSGFGGKSHLSAEDAPINPHAAPDLVIVKDTAGFSSRVVETQHFLALQHANLKFCHGEENSTLYHRRRYTHPGGVFDQLSPQSLGEEDCYGVDWQDPEVQVRMDAHIRASLPS